MLTYVRNLLDLKFGEVASAFAEESSLSDFCVSGELIGRNVFSLFSSADATELACCVVRLETETELLKKQLVTLVANLDTSELFECLEKVEKAQMLELGAEFFYVPSKKMSKNQSIENFAKFLGHMFRSFGLDLMFLKNFFFNDRDSSETQVLINYMKEWHGFEAEDLDNMIAKTVFLSLEKLANQSKVEDFFEVMESNAELIQRSTKIDVQKSLQKQLINLTQNMIFKIDAKEWLKKCFDRFLGLGFRFNEILFNRIIDMVNKNLSDDSLIDFLLEYMMAIGIRPNTITYNIIIDFHCMRGDFERAIQLFHSLESMGVTADQFTLSILVKGLKSIREPSVSTASEFYKLFEASQVPKDIIMFNSLLDVFISMGEIQKAHDIFDDLLRTEGIKPDQVTFNVLVKGCCKAKDFSNAMRYFGEMRLHDIKPNRITYNSLMDLAVKIQDLGSCLFFVEEMQKDEFSPDGYTYSIILNGLKQNSSPSEMVDECLESIRKVVEAKEFKLDEIFFNSILDVCFKYDFLEKLNYFYGVMVDNQIAESSITFGTLIKAFLKSGDFNRAYEIFERMINVNLAINDVTYGCILDACSKAGRMDIALKIFNNPGMDKLNQNSIVYTTIMKGLAKIEKLQEAIDFFTRVKHNKNLIGMIITYNCAVDIYVRRGELVEATKLFEEIETLYKADLISYSTIIKGLCGKDQKAEAIEFFKRMLKSDVVTDVSVVNMLIDSCANVNEFRFGIEGYTLALKHNIVPNDITFGIMIKLYGFARELGKAFELLDLMPAYKIKPSVIIFTNLIHISFYNKASKKAELAFTLFKKLGLRGDKLMYSKLIDGLIRFNEKGRVEKYLDHVIADDCGLKPETMDRIREILGDVDSVASKLSQIEQIMRSERTRKPDPLPEKLKNNYSTENPKNFKRIIHEQNRQNGLTGPVVASQKPKEVLVRENPQGPRRRIDPNALESSRPAPAFKKPEEQESKMETKKPLALFNFREKRSAM